MRVALVALLLPAFAGCLGGDGTAAPHGEGFVATYSMEGEPFLRLTLDGPHDRYGVDLILRPAYRLRVETLPQDAAWDDRDASYFDGAWRLVRDDGCSISSGACARWSIHWVGTFVEGFDVSLTGAFWPFSDSPSLTKSQDGETLVIKHDSVLEGICYEYEGRKPVPVRSCDGNLQLTSYTAVDLPTIPAWPDRSTRPGSGEPANELFLGAEADLQGFGFTSLQALDALKLNSPEAAAKLQRGGCVVTTLFGHGSGGFGTPVPANLLETPVANTSFTVQEADGSDRTKYTVRWVEDSAGARRFSTSIDANRPDHEGGPTCAEVQSRLWPAVSVTEYLQTLTKAFGPMAPDGVAISHQPTFLARDDGLHYIFRAVAWGGAGMYFDATAGRFVYASYIGPDDLEPMQNG